MARYQRRGRNTRGMNHQTAQTADGKVTPEDQTLDFTEHIYSEGVIPVVFLNTLEK